MSARKLQERVMVMTLMLNIKIWNRDFDLNVIYDCYAGEEILDEQKAALNKFLSDNKTIDSSKADVEKYCLSQNKYEIGADAIDNIFKYVMPEEIFVKRDGRVAILCKYKFDEEHGIAIVYKDNAIDGVGSQDIIL